MKTRFARLACAAALLALSVSSATAQNYPARQITLVVPFAPGGPADFLGRLIGQKMGEDLGQQVVIDNRPGANTIIGAQAVAKAAARRLHAADGHRRHPGHESVPVQQACVRPVQGFRAGLAGRARALGGGRKHQHPGQFDQGSGRAGKGQAGHLPDRNQHADIASQCRAFEHDGRHQFHHGPVSRRDDTSHRHSGRRHSARHGEHQRVAAALARQQAQDSRDW